MMPSSVTDTSHSEKFELGSVMPKACSANMTTSWAVVSYEEQMKFQLSGIPILSFKAYQRLRKDENSCFSLKI